MRRLTTTGDDGWIVPEFTWDPNNQFLLWTEQRFVDRQRMPLPLDLVKEIQEAADYLMNAQPPENPTPGELQALPLERRTQIGRFVAAARRAGHRGHGRALSRGAAARRSPRRGRAVRRG